MKIVGKNRAVKSRTRASALIVLSAIAATFLFSILITVLLLSGAASAAHNFDTSETDGTTTFATTPNPRTISYTAGSGSTVMVLNIFTATLTARAGGAPTFNGKTFTQVGTRQTSGATGEGAVEMWYLLLTAADTGSAYTVSVPNTGSLAMRIHVSTYKSASGESALDVSAQTSANPGTNPSQSITTTVDGDVMVDALFTGYTTPPSAYNVGVQLYGQDGGSYGAASRYYLQETAGSQTLSWTQPSDDYALITASFKEVGSILSGYITNKSSGLPLSGVTVTTNTSQTTTTNVTGYYNFKISNGTYIISASLYGYDTNSTTKTISGANVTNANISLSPATASYQLSGYVKDQSSGAAISGAAVMTNTSHAATTDASGYYSFIVYNWTHMITASKTGYLDNSTIITVNGSAISNANISLLTLRKVLVATNRFVILDDPLTSGKTAQTTAGFAIPLYTGWSSTERWSGNQTQITGYVLVLDGKGMPVNNTNVTFILRNWNGADTNTSPTINTNSYGLANYTFDMNARNYYGNWNITATAVGISGAAGFIYNWWGCQSGGCFNHGTESPPAANSSRQNSPYTQGRESITANSNHNSITDTDCAGCHRSYGGTGGGDQFSGQPTKTADVHVTDTCATCHATIATHDTDEPIKSCSDCHNRTDISEKYTMAGSPLRSNYSGLVASTGHNPNSTIPCIICHGPMHNITKPDETQRFIKNNDTEDTHCTDCHQSYNEHNASVNCTLCHSDDVHYIQVFTRNATGGANYTNVTGLSNPPSNCTLCHQNGTKFFNSLENLSKAGNYTKRRDPPQVAVPVSTYVPVEHSNDTAAGTKWNSTGYWNNSIQFTWCLYCHSNTTHSDIALGRPSQFDGNNIVNSSLSISASWCASCHWQGYTNGSNAYGDTISAFLSESLPVPPEITGNATYGANKSNPDNFNHSDFSIKSDIACNGCHGSLALPSNVTALMHNVTKGYAGPDCIGCHDYGKPDSKALHRINNSAMNGSTAMHRNLNSNANNSSVGVSGENRKCWGCHTSNGTPPASFNDMGDRFANPYECYDCHNSTGKPYDNVSSALNVSRHFRSSIPIRAASNASDNSSSCLVCHNLTEMIVSYKEDDNYYSNSSLVSHYGKNRTDLRTWDSGRASNCSYCHQNVSTAFSVAMLDWTYNSSIKNHTQKSANPNCLNSSCHNTGWMHNSSLTRPVFNITNTSPYCSTCHAGREKHNGTQDCSRCHINQSSNDTIHPIKYILSNGSFSTSNTSAADCISCHQKGIAGFPSAPGIPDPLYHSDNATNGSIWNSTAYWTSSLTACTYCHNDTKHNATALGRPAYWKGNNMVNASINTGTWCSSCHYQGYSSGGKNHGDMTSTFASANLSVPPEITNGTYARSIYNRSNYYNHSLTNYNDAVCRQCHGIYLSSGITITVLMHNITGNTCTDCHYSFEAMNNTTRPDRYVDPSMYGTSQHSTLNCTDCHTRGHRNIGARKACEDCHAVQQNPITDRDRHNITATPGASVVNNTDCTSCHSSTLYNRSIATYGYWKPKDCDYCHTYPDKYYE